MVAATLRLLLCHAAILHCAGLTATPSWRPWDDRKRIPTPNTPNAPVLPRIVILGGTGRIGTAVAAHLHTHAEPAVIQLAGRDRAKGEAALAEVRKERTGYFSQSRFEFLQLDWRDPKALSDAFDDWCVQRQKVSGTYHVLN